MFAFFDWRRENKMKITVFWAVAPCCLAEVYRHFRGDTRFYNVSLVPISQINFLREAYSSP
jgi:hypothetical protein